jgi:hypothetical protein
MRTGGFGRKAAVLLALPAAGILALAQPASAAGGILLVNGKAHFNPTGCIPGASLPMKVVNHSDQIAFIFGGPNCTGSLLEFVEPDEETESHYGASIYIT